MKKFLNYTMYVSLLVLALSFSSCQSEFEELPDGNEQESILASSSTAKLIEDISSNDGSHDNIVDGSSCFDIRFPYTVEVNGLVITIDSIEDLKLIEEIFDAVETDDDLLEILFPITITLADYSEITINGKEDLRRLAEQCIEGGDDDDIECIDFVYPITLFTFDTKEVQTASVTVESDRELRRFFAGLDGTDLISIDFPIVLNVYDGTEISVHNNAELAAAIESAKDACDEDDDDDYNDDDFTQERLEKLLVKCPWLIHEIHRNGINQTEQYFEYLMAFTDDGSVVVKDRVGNVINGSWGTRVSDHGMLLKMEFDVLVDFNVEWVVYEIGEGKIKLYEGDGDKIIMNSACDIFNYDPTTLREVLRECSWVIKKVKVDGEEIRRLLGYEFKFMGEGVITLSNNDVSSEGSWEITTNGQDRLVMAITMGQEPGVSFEWPLMNLRNDRLKFEIPGTDYELILQRVCNDNSDDGDVTEIRNTMMGGSWMIAKYIEDDENKTADFVGYDFSFLPEHKITVSENQDPLLDGAWRVLRNHDSKLKVYLNLGEDDPFGSLTDDWHFVSITNNRIELRDVSGDGSIDMLVFERQ